MPRPETSSRCSRASGSPRCPESRRETSRLFATTGSLGHRPGRRRRRQAGARAAARWRARTPSCWSAPGAAHIPRSRRTRSASSSACSSSSSTTWTGSSSSSATSSRGCRRPTQTFDLVVAAGVLYHLCDPVPVLDASAGSSSQIYLWTHYVDLEADAEDRPPLQAVVRRGRGARARGKAYPLHRRAYKRNPTSDPKFIGGVHTTTAWIEKQTILDVFEANGFDVEVAHESRQPQRTVRVVLRPEAGLTMPKAAAVEVEAGDRAVRVSSPDRVIYEATDTTPEVTKLMVAEYFASVEDGLMRALRERPTALERWTSGVRPGMKLATSRMDRGRRRVLPEAGAEGRARLPRGRGDHLPLGTDRRRDLPDRDRGAGVVRAHGDADLPPLARTPQRRGPPRRAAPRPRPAAGHVVHRRRAGGRRRARAAGGARAARLREDLGQPRHPHLRADRAALGVPRRPARGDRLRPRAGPPRPRRDGRLVEGGARASGSSSTSTRTAATAPSPRRTRCGRSSVRPCPRR